MTGLADAEGKVGGDRVDMLYAELEMDLKLDGGVGRIDDGAILLGMMLWWWWCWKGLRGSRR